jgi:hypothetical protein
VLFFTTPLELRAVTVNAQLPLLRPITADPESRHTLFDFGAMVMTYLVVRVVLSFRKVAIDLAVVGCFPIIRGFTRRAFDANFPPTVIHAVLFPALSEIRNITCEIP